MTAGLELDVSKLRGYNRRCIIRPPLEITGGRDVSDGTSALGREGDAELTLNGGTLALNWISFTATSGGDYTGTLRTVLVTLCDATFDPDRSPFPPGQSVLLADTVSNAFVQFPQLPVPRDVAGSKLMYLRVRVEAGPGNWAVRVGLQELFEVSR